MDSVVILAIQKLSGDNLRIHVWILRLSMAILGLRDASASKNRESATFDGYCSTVSYGGLDF